MAHLHGPQTSAELIAQLCAGGVLLEHEAGEKSCGLRMAEVRKSAREDQLRREQFVRRTDLARDASLKWT